MTSSDKYEHENIQGWLMYGYPLYNVWGSVFSVYPISCVMMIERIYMLCLIIIIKSEVLWPYGRILF